LLRPGKFYWFQEILEKFAFSDFENVLEDSRKSGFSENLIFRNLSFSEQVNA